MTNTLDKGNHKVPIWLPILALAALEPLREGFFILYERLVFLALRYDGVSVRALIETPGWAGIIIPLSYLIPRAIPIAVIAIYLHRRSPTLVKGWGRGPSRSEMLVGATVGLAQTTMLIAIVNVFHADWLAGWTSIHFTIGQPGSVFLGTLLIVSIGPLSEELIFRGLFYERLITRLSPFRAAIACSVLFALLHLDKAPTLVVVSFVDSVILCYVYRRSGIWGAWCTHGLANGLKTLYFVLGSTAST